MIYYNYTWWISSRCHIRKKKKRGGDATAMSSDSSVIPSVVWSSLWATRIEVAIKAPGYCHIFSWAWQMTGDIYIYPDHSLVSCFAAGKYVLAVLMDAVLLHLTKFIAYISASDTYINACAHVVLYCMPLNVWNNRRSNNSNRQIRFTLSCRRQNFGTISSLSHVRLYMNHYIQKEFR